MLFRSAPIEAEDSAVVLIEFANGAIGSFEATTAARPVDLEGSLTVMGSGGVIEVGGTALDQIRTWNCRLALEANPSPDRLVNRDWGIYGVGHLDVYADLVECVRTGRRPQVDGIEARRSVALLQAVYASIESGTCARLETEPESQLLGNDFDGLNPRLTSSLAPGSA